jgi:hypothetical protein
VAGVRLPVGGRRARRDGVVTGETVAKVSSASTAINASDGEAVIDPPFVLDRTENPHPKMLAGAVRARHEAITGGRTAHFYWRGYLAAMADATGETTEDIQRWMDRNAPPTPDPIPVAGRTPVSNPRRAGAVPRDIERPEGA